MNAPNGSNFCSQCGSTVAPRDSFCSHCGSAVGGGPSDRDGFRRRIEDLTVEGWEVKHDYGNRVVMVDRGFGSLGIHALLLVFTGGLGNLAYAWYNYSPGADRLELRADGTERYVSGGTDESGELLDSSDVDDTRLRTAGSVVLSFVCALAGLGIFNDGASSLPEFFVGVTFIAIALFAFPPIRRRLENREAVTKFGRVRSTDEAVVDAPDVPCTACARPVENGVERTFHETFYVAGIPILRDEKGSNCYCRSCAQGDPFTDHEVGDEDREKEPEF